jgi:hypothetical protein
MLSENNRQMLLDGPQLVSPVARLTASPRDSGVLEQVMDTWVEWDRLSLLKKVAVVALPS